MSTAAATAEESQGSRMTFATKVLYGFGSVAFGVEGAAFGSLILLFFNQVVGLPAQQVGSAIMFALIFDAICDPLIGQWSDHLRSRWGRRHPFMYASALPLGIAYWMLWNPPHGWNDRSLFIYVFAMLVAVRVLLSLYEIPSAALAPELTPDYDERTSLLAYRFFFGTIGGTLMAILTFQIFLRKDTTHPLGVLSRPGYAQYGAVAALVMLASILISSVGTHRQIAGIKYPPRVRVPLGDRARELITTLSNRSFVSLTAAGLIAAIGAGLTNGLVLYIATYFWELTPKEISILVAFGFASALLGVAIAPAVSKRIGKKRAMIALFVVSAIAGSLPIPLKLIGLMPPAHSFALIAILIVDGIVRDTLGIMGFIIVSSMMADVVEDIAVTTGQRSEGLLFAANGLLAKCISGIGTFLSGVLLALVHFPQGATQGHVDPLILRHLVLIYVPISVGCSAVAIAVLGFYRIDKTLHQSNLERLRDAAKAAEVAQEETEGTIPVTRVV